MENPIGHGAADFGFGPSRMTTAKTCRQKLAHDAVHPERLLQPLFGRHTLNDRALSFFGDTHMIGLGDEGHAIRVNFGIELARAWPIPVRRIRSKSARRDPMGLRNPQRECSRCRSRSWTELYEAPRRPAGSKSQ
jgi:hypothetical protein